MRRLLAIALLTALPAVAQIHGVPPSVTSITPSRSTPGVPASVTSLGPDGFGNRCCSAGFRFGFGQRHFGGGHHGHHRRVVPVYVPYYSYPYYATYPTTYTAPSSAEYEAEEEPPAPTIYERRSRIAYSTASPGEDRYGEHYTDYREQERRRARADAQSDEERQAAQEREQRAQAAKAKAEEKPEEPPLATVLVFKDGHRRISAATLSPAM